MSGAPMEARNAASDEAVALAEVLTEAYKGLLLVNGGAAVSLLAFLQAIWPNPSLSRVTLIAIAIFALALVLALVVPVFRYFHSRAARKLTGDDRRTAYWYWTWLCFLGSVLTFAAAVGYLSYEGIRAIP